MLFSAASLDELFAVSTSFSKSCLGQHPIHTTCKLSDRNVGCTFDAVPEPGSKMYLNLRFSVKFKSSAKNLKLKYIADLLGKPCLALQQTLTKIRPTGPDYHSKPAWQAHSEFPACQIVPYPKYIASLLGKPCARQALP